MLVWSELSLSACTCDYVLETRPLTSVFGMYTKLYYGAINVCTAAYSLSAALVGRMSMAVGDECYRCEG